jgi:hypothetical protein
MHWDPSISFGNVITMTGLLITLIMVFYKFVSGIRKDGLVQANAMLMQTNATNNLAAIIERMQHAAEHQGLQLDAIKSAQMSDKVDLLAHQAKVKEALQAQSAEIGTIVAVHIGKDDERFSAIAATLTRIDAKMDRQGQRQ